MQILTYYILGINVLSAILCMADKIKAKREKWRISEKSLFFVSLIGGAVGMFICMKLVRHKTQHARFMIGLPLIIIFQAAILLFICNHLVDKA